MVEIVEFLDSKGSSLFAKWFDGLSAQAAAKVATYITRIENGNLSSLKSVGQGVHESRIDWGPGYRVYMGKDGDRLIILLGGGTKKRQNKDIERAKDAWLEYKKQKKDR